MIKSEFKPGLALFFLPFLLYKTGKIIKNNPYLLILIIFPGENFPVAVIVMNLLKGCEIIGSFLLQTEKRIKPSTRDLRGSGLR